MDAAELGKDPGKLSLYQRVLGRPFVYNRVRPWIVGGVDMSRVYALLESRPDDVVVDVGCGTGDALHYLESFREYHGFDVDPVAVDFAREQFGTRRGVSLEARALKESDLQEIRPTHVVLAGLLHHLDDTTATGLLGMFARTPSIRRIVTQDVVYLSGETVSNFLARLDRGKFVRREDSYRKLALDAGLEIDSDRIIRSHPETGRARYFVMTLSTSSP